MFFTFSSVSLQSEQDRAGWDLCCCWFRRNARPDSTFAKKHFFMKCSFVETPSPIFPPWVPLGHPWLPLGLPWVPWVRFVFAHSCTLLINLASPVPLSSPWVPLGPPWVSLGSPWVPLVFADSITLLIHSASKVPFGSPWVLFGFLWFPLGSPWVPLGAPLGPLGHPNVTFT